MKFTCISKRLKLHLKKLIPDIDPISVNYHGTATVIRYTYFFDQFQEKNLTGSFTIELHT